MKNFLRVTVLAICAIFMSAQSKAHDNYGNTTMGNFEAEAQEPEAPVVIEGTMTLNATFAGATWGENVNGWREYVTTNTTPAVTVRTTDGTKHIGHSTINSIYHPYLRDDHSFTISIPAPCKIVGYRLTYKGHRLNGKTFTYTNGRNSTTTETISDENVEHTLNVTGLYNSEIAISVSDNSSEQAGFVITALEIDYIFPDGAYNIYWKADNRGYLAYHGTDYPNEAKLAGVTYSGCQNLHYGINDADRVWYLITASNGKRYLFEVATGKFLGVDTSVQADGTGNKLSTSEAWAIAVEPNTNSTRLGHYIITTMISGTKNLLCSGCGTPKAEHPVRWLPVNDTNQKDGGAPLQLVPVNDVTVADNVIAFARNVINGNVQTISSCDEFLNNFTNGKIYYFETSRGVLAALQEGNNLVSTARQNIVENPGMNNPYCQWTVYRSDDNKYYLYNIGKRMFMGTTTTNNGAIPFTETPVNDGLVFKAATKNGYPIMFTCNTNTGLLTILPISIMNMDLFIGKMVGTS